MATIEGFTVTRDCWWGMDDGRILVLSAAGRWTLLITSSGAGAAETQEVASAAGILTESFPSARAAARAASTVLGCDPSMRMIQRVYIVSTPGSTASVALLSKSVHDPRWFVSVKGQREIVCSGRTREEALRSFRTMREGCRAIPLR